MRVSVPESIELDIVKGDILVSEEGVPCILATSFPKAQLVNLQTGGVILSSEQQENVLSWIHANNYKHYSRELYDFELKITNKH